MCGNVRVFCLMDWFNALQSRTRFVNGKTNKFEILSASSTQPRVQIISEDSFDINICLAAVIPFHWEAIDKAFEKYLQNWFS